MTWNQGFHSPARYRERSGEAGGPPDRWKAWVGRTSSLVQGGLRYIQDDRKKPEIRIADFFVDVWHKVVYVVKLE